MPQSQWVSVDQLKPVAKAPFREPPLVPSHVQDPLAILKIASNFEPKPAFDDKAMTPAMTAAWRRFSLRFPDAARAVSGLRVNAALRERGLEGMATPDHAIELNPDHAGVDSDELEALLAHETVHLIRPDREDLAKKVEAAYPRRSQDGWVSVDQLKPIAPKPITTKTTEPAFKPMPPGMAVHPRTGQLVPIASFPLPPKFIMEPMEGAFQAVAGGVNLATGGDFGSDVLSPRRIVDGKIVVEQKPTGGGRVQGAIDLIEGTMKAGLPFLVPQLVKAPVATITMLVEGIGATEAVNWLAEKFGADSRWARLAGDIAGIGVGGVSAARGGILTGAVKAGVKGAKAIKAEVAATDPITGIRRPSPEAPKIPAKALPVKPQAVVEEKPLPSPVAADWVSADTLKPVEVVDPLQVSHAERVAAGERVKPLRSAEDFDAILAAQTVKEPTSLLHKVLGKLGTMGEAGEAARSVPRPGGGKLPPDAPRGSYMDAEGVIHPPDAVSRLTAPPAVSDVALPKDLAGAKPVKTPKPTPPTPIQHEAARIARANEMGRADTFAGEAEALAELARTHPDAKVPDRSRLVAARQAAAKADKVEEAAMAKFKKAEAEFEPVKALKVGDTKRAGPARAYGSAAFEANRTRKVAEAKWRTVQEAQWAQVEKIQEQAAIGPPTAFKDLPHEVQNAIKSIHDDMDSRPFIAGESPETFGDFAREGALDQRTLDKLMPPQAGGGAILKHAAGAPVFHEIMGSRSGTRASVTTALRKYIEGGKATPITRRALMIATKSAEKNPEFYAKGGEYEEFGIGGRRDSSAIDDYFGGRQSAPLPADVGDVPSTKPIKQAKDDLTDDELSKLFGLDEIKPDERKPGQREPGDDDIEFLSGGFGMVPPRRPTKLGAGATPPERGQPGRKVVTYDPAEIGKPIPPTKPMTKAQLEEGIQLKSFPDSVRPGLAALAKGNEYFGRERVPLERTRALAQHIAVNVEQSIPKGKTVNHAEIQALANTAATLQQQIVAMNAQRNAKGLTPRETLQLVEVNRGLLVVMKSMYGTVSETGRALRAWADTKRILQSTDERFIKQLSDLTDGDLNKMAEVLAEIGNDPIKQFQYLRAEASKRMTKYEMLQRYVYGNILSGVATHERNGLSNAMNMTFSLMADVVKGNFGEAVASVKGMREAMRLADTEDGAMALAFPRAMQEFVYVMRDGFSPTEIYRGESGKFDIPRGEFRGGIVNPWNTVPRLLEASDLFTKAIVRQSERYRAAYKTAKAGTEGEFSERMAHALNNLSPEQMAEIDAVTAKAVFQEQAGPITEAIMRLRANVPGLWVIMPFVRIAANLTRQGFEATPLGFAMKGAKQPGRVGELAYDRAMLGTLLLTPIAVYAKAGKITGSGPSDPGEREAWLATGKKPNSIWNPIDQTWVNYQSWQPMALPMMMTANVVEQIDQYKRNQSSDKHAADTAAGFVGQSALKMVDSILNQSFLSGLGNLVDAINDPERYGPRFYTGLSQAFVPMSGASRAVAQTVDPVMRKPEGPIEAAQAIIPGLSTSVTPILDRFGTEVQGTGKALLRGVYASSPAKGSELQKALTAADVTPTRPNARLTMRMPGQKAEAPVKLTGDEQTALSKARGQVRLWAYQRVLESVGDWRKMPTERLKQAFDTIASRIETEVTMRAKGLKARGKTLTVKDLLGGQVPREEK